MNLVLTMTLGDLVVAISVVTTLIGSYFAIKTRLDTITKGVEKVVDRVDEHDAILQDHGEGLAALESQVFGRRRADQRHRKS